MKKIKSYPSGSTVSVKSFSGSPTPYLYRSLRVEPPRANGLDEVLFRFVEALSVLLRAGESVEDSVGSPIPRGQQCLRGPFQVHRHLICIDPKSRAPPPGQTVPTRSFSGSSGPYLYCPGQSQWRRQCCLK